jgi:hypothetical protein
MCMNCGCGEPDARHQPTDITREDLQRAADGSGISLEEAAGNVRTSLESIGGSNQGSAGGTAASA